MFVADFILFYITYIVDVYISIIKQTYIQEVEQLHFIEQTNSTCSQRKRLIIYNL